MWMRRLVISMASSLALCLACGDGTGANAVNNPTDWSSANAIHSVRADDPAPSPTHLRILAALGHPKLCSVFENAQDGDPLALRYLAIYVRDVRAGSHVVDPPGSEKPAAQVRLITAQGDGTGSYVAAQSGTVQVAFDSLAGPMKIELDVAINQHTAVALRCIGGTDSVGEPMETCSCQRDDGSNFECTQRDSKESACCVTTDPQTAPLRATFTSTSCSAICLESGGLEVCKPKL